MFDPLAEPAERKGHPVTLALQGDGERKGHPVDGSRGSPGDPLILPVYPSTNTHAPAWPTQGEVSARRGKTGPLQSIVGAGENETRLGPEVAGRRHASYVERGLALWENLFGAGSMRPGRLGKALKPLIQLHGEDKVIESFERYLLDVEGRIACPEHFAARYGLWPKPQETETPGAKPIPRSTKTVKQEMLERWGEWPPKPPAASPAASTPASPEPDESGPVQASAKGTVVVMQLAHETYVPDPDEWEDGLDPGDPFRNGGYDLAERESCLPTMAEREAA